MRSMPRKYGGDRITYDENLDFRPSVVARTASGKRILAPDTSAEHRFLPNVVIREISSSRQILDDGFIVPPVVIGAFRGFIRHPDILLRLRRGLHHSRVPRTHGRTCGSKGAEDELYR